jgi:cysteine synthase A
MAQKASWLDVDRSSGDDRAWVHEAVHKLEADAHRSGDTYLERFPLPRAWGVDLYVKDESVHPSGSLKHRLARSLFLHALCSGRVRRGTTIVEASSGSTAVSEAYFAQLLELPFIAVVPRSTSGEKLKLIEFYGGRFHLVDDPASVDEESRKLAECTGGYFMDQFRYAERATDWRGNNNIAESIFAQLSRERFPVPEWIVVGAGTGGTSATIGRYVRYRCLPTKVCVVDVENSAYFPSWVSGDPSRVGHGSRIEGIGRPRVEASFIPTVVDRMMSVPDAASIAAMHWASDLMGRRVGGSTGTNLWGALELAVQMRDAGLQGSIVTILCDSGDRYTDTYFDHVWLAEQGLDLTPWTTRINSLTAATEATAPITPEETRAC